MAIFIIDQFSLNTDLPLDIRYVPDLGRLDPDVSAYKYPGMQVFDTDTESIWYADNSLNWNEVGGDSDASLNALYQIISDLSTRISDNDGSINDLYTLTTNLDASVDQNSIIISQHEASIGNLEIRVSLLESSVAYLTDWNNTQDSSIEDLRTDIVQLDASIIRLDASVSANTALLQIHESSIGELEVQVAQLDASIIRIDLEQAVQDISIAYLDSSVTQLFGLIGNTEGSINDLFDWNNSQDASLVDLTDWNNSQDASIVNLEASLGDYVRKDGDTMTGPLTITGGGLQVGTIVSPQDVSIYSDLYIHNNAQIGGNLTIEGSLYVVDKESIDVSAAYIHLNTGLTGTPPASMQSGIIVGRGDSEPYVILYDESQQTFRVGIAEETSTGYLDSSTQAVATREDTPTVDGIAVWNPALSRFDTHSGLTFDGDILSVDPSFALPNLAGASNLMLVVQPNGLVTAVPTPDGSINDLYNITTNLEASVYQNSVIIAQHEASIGDITIHQGIQDASIAANDGRLDIIDGSITHLINLTNIHEASIGDLYNITDQLEASIIRIDGSINNLYTQLEAQDTSVKGAMNIGDGSAAVYAGITNDGSLQFRELVGVGAATINQNGDVIEVGLDAEVNTASNIGTGEGAFAQKVAEDLEFKSLDSSVPGKVIITSDASTIYFDVSIASAIDASFGGLIDVSIADASLVTHQIAEYDASNGVWKNTNEILWDTSLGTTTDDLGSIPQGTDLEGLTLKEILMKILYEYQIPTLLVGSDPIGIDYEKGLPSTQFATIDVSWYSTNINYPLALLNNVAVTKTGSGAIYEASLGLVSSDASVYTDTAGITNWGGINRTINYNVEIDDDQSDQSQPAIVAQSSFTFYYRQYWGMVDGNTNPNQIDSDAIKGLGNSRLAGESDLIATFDNSTGGFVKYVFAYPDTVASPDNFGLLSEILDQNDFDLTDSFTTENEDVSVGVNDVRYRFYIAKNKVDTSTFEITFKF